MSLRRTYEVFRVDFAHSVKRPIYWVLLVLLALFAWGFSRGNVRISSGSSDVAGAKVHLTSEFAMGQILPLLVFLLYLFFIAIAAGLVVIRDEETRVGEVLHATPLTVREYVWGKFAAVLCTFFVILFLHLVFQAFAHYALSSAEVAEFIGPFSARHYVRPAFVFAVPLIVFVTGASFALGAISRKPILVFFVPTAAMLVCAFFVWDWSPSWLDPVYNRLLMWIDPAGARWMAETYLKVDRGVEFYNTQPIELDTGFVVSRFVLVAIGLIAVAVSERRVYATIRGRAVVKKPRTETALEPTPAMGETRAATPLSGLQMRREPTSRFAEILEVARIEARELKVQPGLYLFVPLILVEIIGTGLVQLGSFDTPLLSTPGTLATGSLNTITLCLCFLLLFYTVESLERERSKGLSSIYYATPVRTASILFGKALANSFVGVVILAAALLANWILILIQGKVDFALGPFLLVWGGLAVPTFLVWCTFTTAVFSLSGNRYAAYGLCLGALAFTGYLQSFGHMNWAGNWMLWSVVGWSDMGPLELWKKELVLNRLFVLALSILFTTIAVRFFPRRSMDAASTVRRLEPLSLLRGAWRLLPFLAMPLGLFIWLYADVQAGFQGDAQNKKAKDYWRKNIATWKDPELPSITEVRLKLELEPARRRFKVDGEYALLNDRKEALRQIPVTPGLHYKNVEWTVDGEKVEPESRAGLLVFTPKGAFAPGDTRRLGFRYDGGYPEGATENGGGTNEFILDAGVVLTSFGPSFVPSLGFMEGVGIDKDNKYDAKEYADDFYVGQTDSGFGANVPCTTHLTITAPEEFTINSVGTLTSEEVSDGKRTVVWQSDHPVSFFNVVAGRWAVKRGVGTAIYYHPEHEYNIDEMLRALDAARRWYSEWFYPYPWKELKLSEFPAYDTYAQGFPTNITFSEGIGFLTQSEPKAQAAFMITGHEAAHQWWGNILNPGKGPGGNVLSEGMSHFSTVLLMQQVQGERERIEFLKQIEDQYGDRRQVDSERALVKLDGSRDGDETVTYDKGGWVFWMLLNHMGREQALAGCREFIRRYEKGPDHPVLQDFVAVMREFAPEKTAYDEFTKQWFFEVVVPEYKLTDAKKTRRTEGSGTDGASDVAWEVSARIENKGTSRMPVQVAATRGERYPDEESETKSPDASSDVALEPNAVAAADARVVESEKPAEQYRDARTTITLGPGESQDVVIPCDFEPESVVVDPDALVLQLRRKSATVKL